MFEPLKECLLYTVHIVSCLLTAYPVLRFLYLAHRNHVMTNETIKTFTAVINKETFREKKTLFQRIILQRATQDIVSELVSKKNDKHFATFVIQNTHNDTTANNVARLVICKGSFVKGLSNLYRNK